MKCQILFSGENKKNINNLSSAENAQRVVKVKKNGYTYEEETSFSESSKSKMQQTNLCTYQCKMKKFLQFVFTLMQNVKTPSVCVDANTKC